MKQSKDNEVAMFAIIGRDLIRFKLSDINRHFDQKERMPSDLVFRDECRVVDYEQVDQLYVAVMSEKRMCIVD